MNLVVNRNVSILSCLLLVASASCKTNDSGSNNSPVAPTSSATTSNTPAPTPAATQKKAPSLLIARVKSEDLNKKSAPIQLVSLTQATTIKSGADAAQAYATGTPMVIRQGAKGAEAVTSDSQVFALTAPTSTANNQSSPFPYSSIPDPNNLPQGFYNAMNWAAGAANFMGSVSNTVGTFMQILTPIGSILNGAPSTTTPTSGYIPYTPNGTYNSGGYQYYPYNQGATQPIATTSPANPIPQIFTPNNQGPQYPQYPQG
jgi:hypothetical protein